jgi:hypothetical protein
MDGSFILIFIGITVVGGIFAAIQNHTITSPGRALYQKFVNLGSVEGMHKDEIIAAVGPPTSLSGLPDGKVLIQWQATGCHMALQFSADICQGITHQYLDQS